jgi:hypothetical protein
MARFKVKAVFGFFKKNTVTFLKWILNVTKRGEKTQLFPCLKVFNEERCSG